MQKKGFTLIELMIVVAIIAILAMVAVPMYQRYIERSRNTASQTLLQQLALAQVAVQTEGTATGGSDDYLEIAGADGVNVQKLMDFGFRPDPNVGFSVSRSATGDAGFVAFAAHRAKNSQMYVYDNVTGGGVQKVNAVGTKYANVAAPDKLYIYTMEGGSSVAQVAAAVKSFGVSTGTDGAKSDGNVSP